MIFISFKQKTAVEKKNIAVWNVAEHCKVYTRTKAYEATLEKPIVNVKI